MTDPIETPASQRQQAEGNTGVGVAGRSVPRWAQKRRALDLVHFRGQYLTPAQLHAQNAIEAAEASQRVRVQPAVTPVTGNPVLSGQGTAHQSQHPHPANRFPSQWTVDSETGEAIPLPCRSLETTQPRGAKNSLSAGHKKVANALSWNVAHLCQKYGIDRIGFLTLTFADHVTCAREASRRYNSLATHVLRPRYAHVIRVLERQKSGRIHYHLLVVLKDDIRTGADFEEFAKVKELGKGAYRSANSALRLEWAFWRKTAPLYRFGRTELMPIRSNADALGQYVGKYIGKHIGFRLEEDKGVRLVSYSGDARMATSRHTAVTTHPDQWRAKLLAFVRIWNEGQRNSGRKSWQEIRCMDDLSAVLGPKWAFEWREFIYSLPPADLSIPF